MLRRHEDVTERPGKCWVSLMIQSGLAFVWSGARGFEGLVLGLKDEWQGGPGSVGSGGRDNAARQFFCIEDVTERPGMRCVGRS